MMTCLRVTKYSGLVVLKHEQDSVQDFSTLHGEWFDPFGHSFGW